MEDVDILDKIVRRRKVKDGDVPALIDQAKQLIDIEDEYEALVVSVRRKMKLVRILLSLLAPGQWPVPDDTNQ